MKRLSLCLLLMIMMTGCPRQINTPALDSPLLMALQTRYDQRVRRFLQTQPLLLNGYKHSGSPTGMQFGISSYHYSGHTFAVEESQGRTRGYIDVELRIDNSLWGTCGDVRDPGAPGSGFSTEQAALAQRINPKCFQSSFVPGGISSVVRFVYVHTNGQWRYQTVVQKSDSSLEMATLTQVLGASHADQISVQTPEGQALNQLWRTAFLDPA